MSHDYTEQDVNVRPGFFTQALMHVVSEKADVLVFTMPMTLDSRRARQVCTKWVRRAQRFRE